MAVKYNRLDMNYKLHTLKNGLRVLLAPMPSLESATAIVWVRTGSRFEEKDKNGISHFMEHIIFKGSKKRPSARAISEAVDSMGGEFNAGTSKEWTNFYIKAKKESLDLALDILSDMVLNPLIKSEEVEREKGVIVEEIAMYEDTPIMKIGEVFEETIFGGNSLSWDTAGTEKTVRSITRDDFLRYRKLHYYPENMVVSVAGGIGEKEALGLVEKYFGELPGRSQNKVTFEVFEDKQTKPQIIVKNKKNEQAHFILGFLGNKRGHKDRFIEAILASILGGGMSSRLFIEVRERRGLAYSVRTSSEHYLDSGYLATYAGVDPSKIEEASKVILEQTYGLITGKYPISKEELTKAKEFLKGHLSLSLEDTHDVSSFFGEQELMLSKIDTPEEIFEAIDKVTIEDVLRIAKQFFVPARLNFAVIGPFEDKKAFEKIIK